MITVAIITNRKTPYFEPTREELAKHKSVETVIIAPEELGVTQRYPRERVITIGMPGRGFACLAGAYVARGEAVVFLHGDTVLPEGWYTAVSEALVDERVVGGAFRLAYDIESAYLMFLESLSVLWFRLSGELQGRRAIFARTSALKRCLDALNTPIMEDLQLSKCLRRHGRTVLLDQKVFTQADGYKKHGFVRHSLRSLACRVSFFLGKQPEIVYERYYR